ncbi:hypothetical protein K474DRAFT_329620 [Panus rudis PR-1116 ss-1]|nr:hypothetical protein K474DRAFT_329620 [Panus rudis PR-1116 ss-1]
MPTLITCDGKSYTLDQGITSQCRFFDFCDPEGKYPLFYVTSDILEQVLQYSGHYRNIIWDITKHVRRDIDGNFYVHIPEWDQEFFKGMGSKWKLREVVKAAIYLDHLRLVDMGTRMIARSIRCHSRRNIEEARKVLEEPFWSSRMPF